ncbi:MAG TPA: cytidine deaminase [Acidimicrobiales bacterium]|nr:cytidine deaminase [Acidimicrobiales bacterium]
MTDVDWAALREAASAAAAHAYAPYSGYVVGAAGLVDDGRIVRGCNVENASYGLTLCAECGLVSDLHRTGGGRLVAVVCLAAPAGEPLVTGSPCGRCRQLLFEAGGPSLLVETVDGVVTLDALLPGAFGPSWLP